MCSVAEARWASSTGRRRAGDAGHGVVLGHPVAVIAELLGPVGQPGRPVQGLARRGAPRDGHEVEHRHPHRQGRALQVQLAGPCSCVSPWVTGAAYRRPREGRQCAREPRSPILHASCASSTTACPSPTSRSTTCSWSPCAPTSPPASTSTWPPSTAPGTTIPIVVANMTAVAGRRMAETVARRGGLAVIPQDIPLDVVAEVVDWVKRRHVVHDTPDHHGAHRHRRRGHEPHHQARPQRGRSSSTGDRPVGVVTEGDCAGVDRFTALDRVMSPRPAHGARHHRPRGRVRAAARAAAAPRARSSTTTGHLVGILTRTGALRSTLYEPAVDDSGRLRVAAAVGVNGDVAAKARALVEAGVDVLVLDTAHGHQEKMIDAIRPGEGARPARAARAPATSCPPTACATSSPPAPTS